MPDTEHSDVHSHTAGHRCEHGNCTTRVYEHEHDGGHEPHTHVVDDPKVVRELAHETREAEPGSGPGPEPVKRSGIWYGEVDE